MKLPLDQVLATKPSWATFILSPAYDLWFDVIPPDLNGMSIGATALRVYPKARGVSVAERPGWPRYPSYCLERHIVPGGSFCLGVKVRPLENDAAAVAWWSDLHHFLVLQAISEQTRTWPSVHALSHGPDAARHEVAARAIARVQGIEGLYDRLIDGEMNWLAEVCDGAPLPTGGPLAKSRLKRLVNAELARRRALKDYWDGEFDAGHVCCGTMNNCPLRERERADSADRRSYPTQTRSEPSSLLALCQKDDRHEYSKQI
jgi:hypothetical protein